MGLKVRTVVCDYGSSIRKCFSLLGVTTQRPFFIFEEKKVYCLYDFPHLLKSLRNGWLNCELETPDGIASFQIVKELYEKELNSTTKMCPKLSSQHINPNSFEKMRVKYASQLFSKTVQAAIRTVNDTVGFKRCTKEVAISTADFIQKVDRVFDCMNSASLYSQNKYKSALQLNSEVHEYIKYFRDYLNGVAFCDKNKRVYFLDGMKMSLNAVLLLAEDFLSEQTSKFYIITKSLNQDKLENTFAVVRQKGGNNCNPSVAELNVLFSKIMSSKIIQASNVANCENEIESIIDIKELYNCISENDELIEDRAENNSIMSGSINFEEDMYSDLFLEDVFENSSKINLELLSLRYFIGYIANKILPKINCDNCSRCLRKVDEVLTAPSEMFIFYKNYKTLTNFSNLVAPSDEFLDISKNHIVIFHSIFQSQPHINGIRKFIIQNCQEATPTWFAGECVHHKETNFIFYDYCVIKKIFVMSNY